ncbi:sigma factor [Fimbriiglobus ruber]|uniref:RNA polymerase sigma-70 factor n=1 Tax=Fimbriiglobus ruber TaxID=1908690 RepID=A0A225DUZ8_9BACT|nr:sigma factor [Fimbriiglobus ruber]OWK45161.1 RNA polymerase sigma-70 factor [Fimbriiglobus ruber]
MLSTPAQLLGRIAVGDREAFGTFYDLFAPGVFGLILRLVRTRADADAVLQETFHQLWDQAARYDPARSAPDVWVFMIARARALVHAGCPAGPGLATSERAIEGSPDLLARGEREPIRLAYFHGLTYHEIARRLQLPHGAIMTRIHREMLRLSDRLPAEEEMIHDSDAAGDAVGIASRPPRVAAPTCASIRG